LGLKIGLIIVGLVVGVYLLYPERAVKYGPGAVAPDEPVQTNLTEKTPLELNGYELTRLAEFDITARVLSTQDYSYGRESDLSPLDLALGWGDMSDEVFLHHFNISQGARWMRWKTTDLPISKTEIIRHTANMHMIPANESIENDLADVFKGQVVHLTGFLVRASSSDGWTWTSSMSRNDTGSRACEVFYVESISVVKGAE
jgi:hypothetical protein